jgi:hypothetical protein
MSDSLWLTRPTANRMGHRCDSTVILCPMANRMGCRCDFIVMPVHRQKQRVWVEKAYLTRSPFNP